jgi:sn-glycerol 3-phosphate transport system substrate-binding protein
MHRSVTGLALVIALLLAACSPSDDGGGGAGGDGSGGGDGGTNGGGAAELPTCPLEALNGADGPVEVVVWHSQTAKPEEAIQELVDRYNASQDRVRVRLENQGTSYPELVGKFVTAVGAKDLPDVLVVDDTSTQLLADSGAVLPAQACFEADDTDVAMFDETARAYYTIDDVLYPGSVGLANVLLFYNRDHFRRAGLDPTDPPDTLDELRAAAEALVDAGVTETPLAHEVGSWKTEFWLTGAGASVVDNDNGRGDGETLASALDNDATRRLWTWLDEMQEDGLLLAVPNDPGNIDHYLAMAGENASMLVESSSAASSIEAFLAGDLTVEDLEGDEVGGQESGLEIDAAPFPGLDEPGQMQVGGNAWYVLNGGSDAEQAAAWDFVRFLNEPESQITLTLVASFLPWRTEVVDDERVQSAWRDRLSGRWTALAWQQQVEGLDPAFPGPLIGPYDEVRAAIASAQEDLLLGDVSVDDALATASDEITAALEQYADELG